jgi:hypothetical protein
MCATTIAVVVDSRATAYSRIMQWLHRIGEAIDSLVAWWRRSLTGRVIDRYVSRRGPLLANGLAYGLLFAFFAGVWIVVSALGLVVTGSEEMQKTLLAMLRTVIPSVSDSLFSASMLSGISYPPPGLEPRKPLKTFGFRGFALVPSDCRFPPGSLRFDTFGPDPPRVSHIGTNDSENAFEPSPAVRSSSKSDRVPCVPSVGRFESLHVLRAFFFVLVRNNHSLRIASASQRIPVRPSAKVPPDPLR